MARKYNVEGTKSYLIGSIFCLLMGLWHLRDGWFPPGYVLRDHPITVEVQATQPGHIEEVYADLEQEVASSAPLVRIQPTEPEAHAIILQMENGMDPASKVTRGVIEKIHVEPGDEVAALQPLVYLRSTGDSYYIYNKTTAVIMLIAALACGLVHMIVR